MSKFYLLLRTLSSLLYQLKIKRLNVGGWQNCAQRLCILPTGLLLVHFKEYVKEEFMIFSRPVAVACHCRAALPLQSIHLLWWQRPGVLPLTAWNCQIINPARCAELGGGRRVGGCWWTPDNPGHVTVETGRKGRGGVCLYELAYRAGYDGVRRARSLQTQAGISLDRIKRIYCGTRRRWSQIWGVCVCR